MAGDNRPVTMLRGDGPPTRPDELIEDFVSAHKECPRNGLGYRGDESPTATRSSLSSPALVLFGPRQQLEAVTVRVAEVDTAIVSGSA
jgi:hypothetical protein